jgi:pimeloyl-ACP methyl ester carboxylesterase
MDQWNHEYAKVNNVKLHYVKEGNGETLVILLHGWPEFWYSWQHQITALKEQYTVVAPDLRGFNLSDKPKNMMEYVQSEVAKDIIELIDYLGFEKAVVVGHDWGGAIAWHIAINYPEKVDRFIVMNCPHPAIFMKHLQSNPRQMLRSAYMFFFQIPLLPEFLMKNALKQMFVQFFRGWAYHKQNFPDAELDKYVEAYQKEGALTSGLNYYRANIRAELKAGQRKNRKVQAPTLMIWGEGDKALGKELVEGTEKYIEGPFTLKWITNSSHWIQNDFPEAVNTLMLDFLATK